MQHRQFLLATVIILIGPTLLGAEASDGPFELTIENIMRDAKWIGISPNRIRWTEDGKEILFQWNPENEEEASLYAISRSGGEPRRLSDEERNEVIPQRGDYDRDRTRKVYVRDGDLFLLDIKRGRVRQITNTVESEAYPAFTGDGEKIVYRRDNNLYLMNLTSGDLRQLTDFREGGGRRGSSGSKTDQEKWLENEELQLIETLRTKKERRERQRKDREARKPARPQRISLNGAEASFVELSPDEQFVTFRLDTDPEDEYKTIVPNYITESGFTETIDARPKVGAPQGSHRFGIYDLERDTVYYVATDDIPGIDEEPEYLQEYRTASDSTQVSDDDEAEPQPRPVIIHGPDWSDDGSRAVVVIRSLDNKDRWLMSLDPVTGDLSLIDRQRDEAWIGGPGMGWWNGSGALGWLPDNKRIWFQSEATGYSHLYVVDVTTLERQQLTSGQFEVSAVTLSRDKKWFYYISNEIHPGERHFYRLPVSGGRPDQITSISGGVRVSISPDEKKLALLHSYSNRPRELYLQDNKPGAEAVRVTHSLSDDYVSYDWRDPEIVTFTARDSAEVYARIYHPKEGTKNGAAVVFVHGAGYIQNVCRWWTWYFREMMFHNFLADRGYTVLDIDFRGSAGYGRDWRTGIYRHMGGKDLTDQVDGVRFLVANYGIDPERVGLYGGSYGGFITLMALFTEAETFAAGAALRSVTDFAHYNHGYTSNILNLPYTDSLAYVRSAPIYFAEGLQGALLICHGMSDTNVHFQDVVRLAQRLIELGKDNWEMAIYPAEAHSFTEPSSWTDEYKRIFKLFEENLK